MPHIETCDIEEAFDHKSIESDSSTKLLKVGKSVYNFQNCPTISPNLIVDNLRRKPYNETNI